MRQKLQKNKPQDFAWHSVTAPVEGVEPPSEDTMAQAAIEDYLDRVCLPLLETLTYNARLEMRREIAQHLAALVEAYQEMGDPPVIATQKALVKFGNPEQVARLWQPAYGAFQMSKGKRAGIWFRRQWPGMVVTLSACALLFSLFAGTRPAPTPTKVASAKIIMAPTGTTHAAWIAQKIPCASCHRMPIGAPDRQIQRLEAQLRLKQTEDALMKAEIDAQVQQLEEKLRR